MYWDPKFQTKNPYYLILQDVVIEDWLVFNDMSKCSIVVRNKPRIILEAQ